MLFYNHDVIRKIMIIKYPNKILFTQSVDATQKEAEEIVEKLKAEANNLTWGKIVGLAAPQLGINKNVFLALDKPYVNPKILWYSFDKKIEEEGCYSLEENKFDYPVSRALAIEMRWNDLRGQEFQGFFRGFHGQVLQHEYDHLQGKLCCER